MSWRIIVASSDAEQRDELKKGAAAIADKIVAAGDAADIQEATTVAEVKSLRTKKDLVIATAALSDKQPAPGPQDQPGLDLIKSIQSQPAPPPCILVSDRPEHRTLTKGMMRCRWLQVGPATDYIEDCVLWAKELDVWAQAGAKPQPAGKSGANPAGASVFRDNFALIEVDVPDDTRSATIKYVINVDDRVTDVPAKRLGLAQKKVDELVEESRKLSDRFSRAMKTDRTYERWQADYRALGERFHKLLDTDVFAQHFNTVRGVVMGRSDLDIRLRFSLGRLVFDGLWESLLNPEGKHMMLEAAITRRERDTVASFSKARSGEVGTLNILVVGSTLDDNSAIEGPDDILWKKQWGASLLNSLPHIENEIAAIRAIQKPPYKVRVEVLSGEDRHQGDGDWSLAETVKRHLADNPDRYDVIHFAGHALFASAKPKKPAAGKGGKKTDKRMERLEDDRGYLIFSGKKRPRAVSIATVANWLRNTSVELVYLSCCRSSASRAAAEFARNSIRTTIGFSWDLDDKKAVDFTRQFYDELLRNRLNVCSALRKAREDLHREHENGDPIWASPVLFAQPSDWGNVEGVLRPPVRPEQDGP